MRVAPNPFLKLLTVLLIGVVAIALSYRHAFSVSYSKPVPAVQPAKMREWRYIVIHHSGSSTGNEEVIQEDHLRRGMENGMAYHFLIGNGTLKLSDGEVVEGRRWKYQIHGGHCHQDFLNQYGIGICLVGNFKNKMPTAKQEKALAELIYSLQREFHIPDDHVHGHGEYYGEDTDCPGKQFPWNKFWASLQTVHETMLASHKAAAAE